MLVVNAVAQGCRLCRISEHLPEGVQLEPIDDRALVALQGPKAAAGLARHCPKAAHLAFMTASHDTFDGIACHVARSGYTGEDGFEISVAAKDAVSLVETLARPSRMSSRSALARAIRCASKPASASMAMTSTKTTSPVEADLVWSIGKRRRRRAASPAPAASARAPRRREAQARRHQAGGPRAGARRAGSPTTDGRADWRRHLRRLRPDGQWPGRHGLCRHGLCRARDEDQPCGARQADAGESSPPCRSCRTTTNASLEGNKTMSKRYTKEHEWISVDGDIATIGITNHAQEQLGDVVFVELPAVGKAVTKGGDAARGRIGQGGERSLCAGLGRGRRGEQGA